MAIQVGRWDCPTCGKKGNLGPQTQCASCGSPRPKNVVFYLPKDAKDVTDDRALREARAGADWVCGHCEAHNKASAKDCKSCGNPRDAESDDLVVKTREYASAEVPNQTPEKERPLHPDEQPKAKSRPKGWRGLLYTLLVAVAGWFGLTVAPKTVDVQVTGFGWERTVQMMHFEPVQHEEWSTPAGAYNIRSFRAIHHYNQVLRGYETRTRDVEVQVGSEDYKCGSRDMGNGYFEDVYCSRPIYETRQETYQEPIYDQVPVYQTKYSYTLKEWVAHPQNLLKASAGDQKPHWPEASGKTDPETWREGAKTEEYTVKVTDDKGEVFTEKIPISRWQNLKQGQTIQGKKVRILGTWKGLVE